MSSAGEAYKKGERKKGSGNWPASKTCCRSLKHFCKIRKIRTRLCPCASVLQEIPRHV